MAWIRPKYTRQQVDQAARDYAASDQLHALFGAPDVITNWRASHAFPLNTLQMNLRSKARKIDSTALIAQRIKREASIWSKLTRLRRLPLSEMQDIGGCRAVMKDMRHVRLLIESYDSSRHNHERAWTNDYIEGPKKKSGYRSYHIIFKYRSNDERYKCYNGHRIEIQIRSRLQHIWATAVEIVDAFTGQALKSNLGSREWRRFFQLVSSYFAIEEGTNAVPETPSDRGVIRSELIELDRELGATESLQLWSALNRMPKDRIPPQTQYNLIIVDREAKAVRIESFTKGLQQQALERYEEVESQIRGNKQKDAVLVSADSLAQLKAAYPNYFLDTRAFVAQVHRLIQS